MTRLSQRLDPLSVLAAVVGVVVLVGIPLLTDTFQTFMFANVAVFFVAILGLNLLTGYNGQISLGNGAFMAIGGYTTALLVKRVDVPYLLTIPIAGILAGTVGFLFGVPALRLRGIYLALATFALALSVTPVLNNYDQFTGGHAGINLTPVTPLVGLDLSHEQWLYFLNWIVAGILFIPAVLLVSTRTGRAWMAIRDSETAALASGVNISYYKTLAFGISAFYAGVAGALQVVTISYINPDGYSLNLSLQLLVGAVIGGLGFAWGPLFGSLFIVWLPYFAEKLANVHVGPITLGGKPDIGFGVLLLLLLVFAPSGLAGVLQRGWARYRSWRSGMALEAVAESIPSPTTAPEATPAAVRHSSAVDRPTPADDS